LKQATAILLASRVPGHLNPRVLCERGSASPQHILDACHERVLAPRIAIQTTSTETIVSMVEAGLGASIVLLLPNGAVTRGRRVRSAAWAPPSGIHPAC
jgi:DNA-binding transcriptional LysR family regulator